METPFTITVELFQFRLLVCIGTKPKDFLRLLKKWDIPFDDYQEWLNKAGFVHVSAHQDHNIILYIKYRPTTPTHKSLLAHEIFHVVDEGLRLKGLKLDESTSEVYAYTTQYLTKEIYSRL